MKHEEIQNLLDSYYSKELGVAETLEVTTHLRDCLECQDELEVWRRLSESRPRPHPVQTERVVLRVMNTLRLEAARSGWKWGGWRPSWSIALAAGSLAAAVFLLQFPREKVRLDDLLFSSEAGKPAVRWILDPEKPKMDELVGILWEGV
jgi:anti-sigma factor RsiW